MKKISWLILFLFSVESYSIYASSSKDDLKDFITSGKEKKLFKELLEDKDSNQITPPSTPRMEDEDNLSAPKRLLSQVKNIENLPTAITEAQQECSKKFLNPSKTQNIVYVQKLFDQFKIDYEDREAQIINITGLSSRARISLLRQIINYKLTKLKYYFPPKYKTQEYKGIPFWIKPSTNQLNDASVKNLVREKNIRDTEAYDLLPTTFQIGDYLYTLRLGAMSAQRGSGKLSGLYDKEFAGTYAEIIMWLNGIESSYNSQTKKYDIYTIKDGPLALSHTNRKAFMKKLIEQKKEGKIITSKVEGPKKAHREKFFNGFNLLLDYEVARRLVDQDTSGGHTDSHPNLAVIFFMKKVIKIYGEESLSRFNSYFLPETEATRPLREFLLKKNLILDPQEAASPLSGEKRQENLSKAIHSIGLKQTKNLPKKLRKKLLYLHKNDENSEEFDFLSNQDSSVDDNFLSSSDNKDIKNYIKLLYHSEREDLKKLFNSSLVKSSSLIFIKHLENFFKDEIFFNELLRNICQEDELETGVLGGISRVLQIKNKKVVSSFALIFAIMKNDHDLENYAYDILNNDEKINLLSEIIKYSINIEEAKFLQCVINLSKVL